MTYEIERKFLLKEHGEFHGEILKTEELAQAYLSMNPERIVRIRTSSLGTAWLTVKGKADGAKRLEIETEIDFSKAAEMMRLAEGSVIRKTRTTLKANGDVWEIDQYHGDNSGLWTAEIELSSENQQVAIPEWVGQEVTDDHRYANSSLAETPVKLWGPQKNKDLKI